MDKMGSTPSHEAGSSHAAAPADAASTPLRLPPTSQESKAANETTALSSVDDKRSGPNLKRKLETRNEETHATGAAPKAKRKKTQKGNKIISIEVDSGSTMAPADDPIDLSDIKEWISAYEANPQPASLTPAQRKAILDLKAAIAKEVVAPEIGEEDWISALQLYRDTDASKRRGVEFTYEDVGVNGQFKCFCNFKGPLAPERMTFPREDCGFVAVDTKGTLDAPSFSRKKDARRYAAKQTVIWLRRQGQVVPFPKVGNKTNDRAVVVDRVNPASTSVAKSEDTNIGGVANPTTSAASTLDPVKPSNTNGDIVLGGAADAPEDEVPATVRVTKLCNALGIQVPAYRLSPADNGQEGFYNGYADFGTDSLTLPKNLGCVSNCCTKSGTREQIAAMVLEHLLAYQAKRNIQLANVEGKFGGDASGGAALT